MLGQDRKTGTTTVAAFPSVDEVVKTDAFPTAIWQLEPHQEGMLPVAVGRGGPFKIHWEVHGDGPVKLVLIGGLGVVKSSWQRQTMHFGHLHGDQYSVLIIDNRGIGRSDKPLIRYSTSAMAADLLEVLDHLSWTVERQLHICGISKCSEVIAQELAYAAPHRIASLNLICTAAAIENTTSFSENVINRINLLIPKRSVEPHHPLNAQSSGMPITTTVVPKEQSFHTQDLPCSPVTSTPAANTRAAGTA
ncbi:hypothetical protein O1611_g6810 [Lasiodiplodia mahajangana]|uniref:Uncharacterized protein n=1 Tax=Lasiodiplodia mahajangana TaxID=1108764 RepID=A0ACC2JH35_9PEZI|nr:hypothetical protein O1611_g6810 [Lasiodiplodia mahajangana]